MPRADLKKAEQLKKKSPELAKKVESGETPLDRAAEIANLPKPKKNTKIIKPLAKTPMPSGKSGVKTAVVETVVFDDGLTKVIDRIDSIRFVRCGAVTILHHDDLFGEVIVYGNGDVWWFGSASKNDHQSQPTRKEARTQAIRLVKAMKAKLQ